VFEGFGNEVPLEIVKAHGIPKVADIIINIKFLQEGINMSDNKTAGQKLWENLSYNCPMFGTK